MRLRRKACAEASSADLFRRPRSTKNRGEAGRQIRLSRLDRNTGHSGRDRIWRAAIKDELEMIGSPRSIDDLEIASMLFFDITSEKTGSDS